MFVEDGLMDFLDFGLEKNKKLPPTRGIANKGFSGIRKVVARSNFSCTLIGNRPQSLTGHTATVSSHLKKDRKT